MRLELSDLLGMELGDGTVVPNRFLFEFEIPLRFRADFGALERKGRPGFLDAERLPDFGEMEGERVFADVWACWNEGGLAVGCAVRGRSRRLKCDVGNVDQSDCFRVCVDTRGSRDLRRANRFCRQFCFMPTGGGSGGDAPVILSPPFRRSNEEASAASLDAVRAKSTLEANGYSLTAIVPRESLPGYDPIEHPRIGIFYMICDRQLGRQSLTVGDELPWDMDPSTWATAVLSR